jgi:hypothetical protein
VRARFAEDDSGAVIFSQVAGARFNARDYNRAFLSMPNVEKLPAASGFSVY